MPKNTMAWCLDIDGTLVRFQRPINGAAGFIAFLQDNGIPYVIVSNTGQKSACDVQKLLFDMLHARVELECIFTARDTTFGQLRESAKEIARVLVVNANPIDVAPHAESLHVGSVVRDCETRTCIALFFDGWLPEYCQLFDAHRELRSPRRYRLDDFD